MMMISPCGGRKEGIGFEGELVVEYVLLFVVEKYYV